VSEPTIEGWTRCEGCNQIYPTDNSDAIAIHSGCRFAKDTNYQNAKSFADENGYNLSEDGLQLFNRRTGGISYFCDLQTTVQYIHYIISKGGNR
jgi:hypothetical protein